MPRRHIILTAVLLTGGIGAFLWWHHTHVEADSGGPLSAAQSILDPVRWAPMFDNAIPFQDRLAQAKTLDATFPLASLSTWAATIDKHDATQATEQHFVIYNEVIEQSRRRNLQPTTLTPFLTAALKNAALHATLRDYAAQHLAMWLTTATTGQPAETDSTRLQQGLAALCSTVGDETIRHETIPGTALLALADMEQNHTADLTPHWPTLDASLAKLIPSADTPLALRVSALQAAATAKRTAHLPAIRALISTAQSNESILISAIAALGSLGDATDRPALQSIITSGTLASHAATAALKRLPL